MQPLTHDILRARIAVAIAAVALVGTAHAASAPTVRLYGLVYPAHVNPQPVSLARLDPLTLSPVGRPSVLGRFYGFAVPSPDERRAALVAPNSSMLRLYEGGRLVRLLGLGAQDEAGRLVVRT